MVLKLLKDLLASGDPREEMEIHEAHGAQVWFESPDLRYRPAWLKLQTTGLSGWELASAQLEDGAIVWSGPGAERVGALKELEALFRLAAKAEGCRFWVMTRELICHVEAPEPSLQAELKDAFAALAVAMGAERSLLHIKPDSGDLDAVGAPSGSSVGFPSDVED